MLKNKKGFSLIEAVFVIAIIGISVVMWGYYGVDHVGISMMQEAKMFVEKIVAQEKKYYADKGYFYFTAGTDKVEKAEEIFIDTKGNKYFKKFRIRNNSESVNYVIIEMYPDTKKYPDLTGCYVTGKYYPNKDIIDYQEIYEE